MTKNKPTLGAFLEWLGGLGSVPDGATLPPASIGPVSWPVISLWEPWASAMALNLKLIETRRWPTKYRGPILIHAAKRPVDYWEVSYEMSESMQVHGIEFGLSSRGRTIAPYFDGTYGRIIALANLADCKPTAEIAPSDQESAWGNYAAGRFGWIFSHVRPIEPIAARGYQRIWHYEGPITLKKRAA